MPKRRRTANTSKPSLSKRQYIMALFKVAQTTYRAAPLAVIVQLIGAVISAVLPLATTYFAAATTTVLAAGYAGDAGASTRAIEYVIITAVLGVVMMAWKSLESYLSQAMRYRVEAAMTDRMFYHFLALDFWRYDDKETVDLYEKAKKFAQFFPYIFQRLSTLISALVSMIAGIIALLFVSWWLAVIALAAIIPGLTIQLKLSRLQTKHWNENIEARRVVNWIEWGIMQPSKIAELRLYGVVRELLDLRQTMRDKDQKTRIDFERSYIWKRLFGDVIEAAAEVVALVWVTLQIVARQQPIGQFIYVQQVVSRAIGGAGEVVSSLSSIDEDIANLFDYQRFMDLVAGTDKGKKLSAAPNAIVINNVSFHYPQVEKKVLSNVSLSIEKGQHIAIVGENGAGKSTLVKIVTGLYQPTNGSVDIDGLALTDIQLLSWHQLLGVLSQDFIRYDFTTARHNIRYGDVAQPYSDDRLNDAIETAEAGFLHDLPQGIDTFVNRWMEDDAGNKGMNLSGGQWQRLALARNFYRKAPIIILDEPTSAIDALAESRIFNHLFRMKDKTIITISHRLKTVEKADVVYMLKDGVIVERGKAAELIQRRGAFYRMFESQI